MWAAPASYHLFGLCTLALPCLPSCTLLLQRDGEQCHSHADCQALGPEYVCASDSVCVPISRQPATLDARDKGECHLDSDCQQDAGPRVCRKARCLALDVPELSCVSDHWGNTPEDVSNAVLVGILAPLDELAPNIARRRLTGAVGTAINGLNRVRSDDAISGLPALLGVACDEARAESVEYMVRDLGVNILIGPGDATRVESLLSQLAERALLWSPFSDISSLTPASDSGPAWLVSCRPSRAGMVGYFMTAVSELRTDIAALGGVAASDISPVLAVSDDPESNSLAARLDPAQLDAAGVRLLRYPKEPRGRGLVSALTALEPSPNLIIAASGEDDWLQNMVAFDAASFTQWGTYPYYLLAEKRTAYLRTLDDQAANDSLLPPARVFGLDMHLSPASALLAQGFGLDYQGETGLVVEAGLEYAFDCAQLAVYSAIAAASRFSIPIEKLTPETLVAGLGALAEGTSKLAAADVDAKAIVASLVTNSGLDAAVDLFGASGDLDFESAAGGDAARRIWVPRSPDGELYCIDADTRAFCDTGVVFPVEGSEPSRGAPRCACLGAGP
jgi:hypothetical protein